ncbi:hypothetical protein RvY_00181-2 [Ramazzottius varieornatus]|uniref:Uncharacterized protein n=1 Tax=Ramazzottius varieornatus TaxID=947166 RepID=A0A1D1ULS8_RAMVA|nr:hypothetical protein RvY_00181-2 [Ramazzottius varieornatus]
MGRVSRISVASIERDVVLGVVGLAVGCIDNKRLVSVSAVITTSVIPSVVVSVSVASVPVAGIQNDHLSTSTSSVVVAGRRVQFRLSYRGTVDQRRYCDQQDGAP